MLLDTQYSQCGTTYHLLKINVVPTIHVHVHPPLQFVLEPSQALVLRPFQSFKRSSRGPSAVLSASAVSGSTAPKPAAAKAEPEISPVESKPTPLPILLQPLVNSWMEVKYCHIRCLHVWSMDLEDDAVVSLV